MSTSFLLLFFFSALGAFNGFVLSVYIATQSHKKAFANYFLSLLLFVLSIRIAKSVFFYFNPSLANIFIQIGLSACILIGPFLFLYLKSSFEERKPGWILHVIPFLTAITLLGFLYPYVAHRTVWSRWIVKAIYLQWLLYLIASFRYIKPISQKLLKKEPINKLEIWQLSIFGGVFAIWLAYNLAPYTSYILGAVSFTFILYLIVLLLLFKKDTSASFSQEKYKNKEISPDTQKHIAQKLTLIPEKELYLNPGFSLEMASKELNISKHILSQYVNEVLGKSFSTLIKEYRVEKAKQLIVNDKNFTMEGLGYDSGFSSKSTFFIAFKAITGLTPAEFKKQNAK